MESTKVIRKIVIGEYVNEVRFPAGSWIMYNTDMEFVKAYIEPKPMFWDEGYTVTWKECKVWSFDEHNRLVSTLETYDHVPSDVCNDFDKVIEKKGYKVIEWN